MHSKIPFLLLILLCGCVTGGNQAASSAQSAPTSSGPLGVTNSQETTKPATTVRLRAVGDLMAHAVQLRAASRGDGAFEFEHVFAGVKPLLENADLTFGNLETTLAGPELFYSGYPTFNTPDSYADALVSAGFDLLQTANNHSRDRRKLGIDRTLASLDSKGLKHVGTFSTEEEAKAPALHLEIRGISFSFLAYTFSTNDIPSEPGQEWTTSILEPERIVREVRAAKEQGSEVVVVGLHWGDDYVHEPQESQRALAQRLADAGVDLILGTHPHVLQPTDWVTRSDGQGRVLVAWSLGNFLSNQRELPRATGLVLEVPFVREQEDGPVTLGNPGAAPVWTDADGPTGEPRFRLRNLLAETPLCESDKAAIAYELSPTDCETMLAALQQSQPYLEGLTPLEAPSPAPDPAPLRESQWDEVLSDSLSLRKQPLPHSAPFLGSPIAAASGAFPERMVHIESSQVSLGTEGGEANESPRLVELDDFAIDIHEVRTEDYARFLAAHPGHRLPGAGIDWAVRWAWTSVEPPKEQRGKPISMVSREEARAFCAWRGARLPTEDEWELAARGPDGLRFPWGEGWYPTFTNWYDRPRPGAERVDGSALWAEVDSYEEGRSPFGLYNMAGNVAEWVDTDYQETELAVLKGGSWFTNNPHWLRPAFRYFTDPEERSTIYGFRCARDL